LAPLKVVAGTQPGSWQKLVSDYEAAAQARGLSPRTIEHYSDSLRRVLLPFCEREGVDDPAQLSKRHLERLSVELQAKGLARPSIRSYLSAVNHFLRWCAREGELPAAVTAPQLRQERVLIDVLSRQEIDLLEAAASTERDKLIVRVLADTGMRLGELRGLRVDDLVSRGRERFLRVRGKGSRERLVPVQPGLFVRLERYAHRTRPEDASSSALFLTLTRANGGEYQPLAEPSIQHLLRYLGRRAGLTKRIYPHLLRHSFATQMLRRGMNPIQLKDILGHSSLAMLDRVYSHLAPTDAYQALIEALRTE
jgi:site-specific recombinase XerD